MEEFVFILESVRYDLFMNTNLPNMKSIADTELAIAGGRWTKPAIVSLFSGYLPESKYTTTGMKFRAEELWNPSWVLLGFDTTKNLFLNSNAWVYNMQPRNYTEKFFDDPSNTYSTLTKQLEFALEHQSEYDRIIIFEQETHKPYTRQPNTELVERVKHYNHYNNNDTELPALCMQIQSETLKWIDTKLGTFLNKLEDSPRIIITSDHGELFGEHNKIGHAPSFPFHIKLLEVPLIINK